MGASGGWAVGCGFFCCKFEMVDTEEDSKKGETKRLYNF